MYAQLSRGLMKRYVEVADVLRERITSGEWPPGTTIPRMTDLAAEFDVARSVIAAAVRMLESEGLLYSVKRRGTVVQQPVRRRISRGNRVWRRRTSGYSFAATAPGERWVHHIDPIRGVAEIPERPAELLGVEPGSLVFRRRRVTSPEGEPPFALSDSWISPEVVALAPGVAEAGVPGGYLDHLEAAGHGPLSWREISRARPPSKEEAALLRIPTSMWVMEVCRVATSGATGEPVDVTVMIIPADRVEIVMELERDPSAIYQRLSEPGGPHSPKEP